MKGMGGMEHGGMGGMMGGMEHGGGMAGMMRHMLCGVTEHVEGRLAYLKAELKLTDAQQAAWNTFADAYRATTQKTAKVCTEMDAAGPDHSMHKGVLGHLTMMEHHMSAHLDSVRGLKAAIEPLFAVLTETRKKPPITSWRTSWMLHEHGMGMGGMDHGAAWEAWTSRWGIEHIPFKPRLIARLLHHFPPPKKPLTAASRPFGGGGGGGASSGGPLSARSRASLAVVKSLASGAARASGVQTPAARSSRY